MNDRLVWIDCEMTGLDLGADALIEVAALVTDFELNVLGEGIDIIVKPPPEALDQMNDFVSEMHEKSGLTRELDFGITLQEAEERVLAYIKEHCPDGSRPPLAGNTVATDRAGERQREHLVGPDRGHALLGVRQLECARHDPDDAGDQACHDADPPRHAVTVGRGDKTDG